MKRQKLHFTFELLDKILKLEGAKIYNVQINDTGVYFDVYDKGLEYVEGALNTGDFYSLYNWEDSLESIKKAITTKLNLKEGETSVLTGEIMKSISERTGKEKEEITKEDMIIDDYQQALLNIVEEEFNK